MRRQQKPGRKQLTSTSITLTLSVPRARQQTLLGIATIVLLLVTIFSASSAHAQTTECHLKRTDLEKYKCLALEANEDAKKANQAAKDAEARERAALAREKAATEQRDTFIDELETCQTDRDQAAKGEADAKTRNLELESKVAPLVVDNTLHKAENAKLKKQRWLLFGAGIVLGVVGGVGSYIWVTK